MAKIDAGAIKQLVDSITKNPKLIYEEVLNQEVHTGSITLPLVYPESVKGQTVTVPFILTNDLSFSLGNKWETILPTNIDLISKITGIYNGLTTLSDQNDSQISFQSKLASTANYHSSQTPSFTVELTFVCTQRSYNPSEIIKTLSAMCLPLKWDMAKAQTTQDLLDGTITAIKSVSNAVSNVTGKVAGIISNAINKPDKNSTSTSKNAGAQTKTQSEQIGNSVGDIVNSADESSLQSKDFWTDNTTLFDESADNPAFSELSDSLKKLADKSADAINESMVMAPLYYQAVYDETTHNVKIKNGTISLRIGKWFNADNLICESISNIKFSKEVIAPLPSWAGKSTANSVFNVESDNSNWGFPLYATCTLTLRPCTIINYEDFCNYFTLSSSGKTTATNSIFNYIGDAWNKTNS